MDEARCSLVQNLSPGLISLGKRKHIVKCFAHVHHLLSKMIGLPKSIAWIPFISRIIRNLLGAL